MAHFLHFECIFDAFLRFVQMIFVQMICILFAFACIFCTFFSIFCTHSFMLKSM